MKAYAPDSYGERHAEVYDSMYEEFPPYPGQIELLKELATDGRAVELGVGTGRVAIPLAESGVEVHGLDVSQRMLSILTERSKGLTLLTSALGDASEFSLPKSPVTLIYAVFNFLFLLPDRERQLSCLRSCKRALGRDGRLLLELFVPHFDAYLPDGQSPGYMPATSAVHVRSISADHVTLFASKNFAQEGVWKFQDIHISEGGVRLFPCVIHYLRPDQLDVLAEAAGLRLVRRYEDWIGGKFTPHSRKHVSVYAPLSPH